MAILELEQQEATQAVEHQVAATRKSHKKYRKYEKGSSKKELIFIKLQKSNS